MNNDMNDYLVQPLATGLVAGAATYAIFGASQSNLSVFGFSMPPPVALGVVAAGSDIIGTVVAKEAMKANDADQWDESIKMAMKPAITGAFMVGASRVLIGEMASNSAMLQVAGLGAASSVGGSYLVSAFPKE
jgi:hypothetical protein